MTTVNIQGTNPFDENIRVRSVKTINELPTDILDKLSQLAQSPKAVDQLKNNFNFIKTFLG